MAFHGKRLLCLILLAASLCFASVAAAADAAGGIRWFAYDEGMALGRQEGKKIFLSFHADWCAFCKKMEKESFSKPAIIDYLNKHFISIKVNTDEERDTAVKYFVRGLPVTWFLEPDGTKIGGNPGYIPPKQLLALLKYIHTDSYKTMQFNEFQKGLR